MLLNRSKQLRGFFPPPGLLHSNVQRIAGAYSTAHQVEQLSRRLSFGTRQAEGAFPAA